MPALVGSRRVPVLFRKAAAAAHGGAFTLTGPSSSAIGTASANFTAQSSGTLTSPVVVTPNDGGAGGTFTPATVTLAAGSNTSATFTYTPATLPETAVSVGATNGGGLTNPAAVTFHSTIPGLTGRWDASQIASPPADGASLTTWNDIGGGGNSLTPLSTAPIYHAADAGFGGLPSVDMSAGTGMATGGSFLSSAYNTSCSLFFAMRYYPGAQSSSTNSGDSFVYSDPTQHLYCYIGTNADPTAGTPNYTAPGSSYPFQINTGPGGQFVTRGPDGLAFVFGVVYDGTDDTEAWQAHEDQVAYSTALGVSGALTLFAQQSSGSFPFQGRVGEAIACDAALTHPQRLALARALAKKWSLALPRLLVAEGDSLTAGANASSWSTSYPSDLATALPAGEYALRNVAVAGTGTGAMLTRQQANVLDIYVAQRPRNVALFWGGTNDIGTLTDAQIETNIQDWCQNAQAQGYKVCVFTILPRGSLSSFETSRQNINTWIRANYASWADELCDVGNDATIGQAGDQNNATYYNSSDLTHLTDAGYAIVAGYAKTAVQAIG